VILQHGRFLKVLKAKNLIEMPFITAAQVSSHSKNNDCWIIIHGKVYDVTKFLQDHPGGEDVLLDLAGSDF
jgi:cytochrome-b5 reductase